MPIPTARVALFSFLALVLLAVQPSVVTFAQSSGKDHYLQKIKPLFTEKCIACHGAIRAEAGLRLDAIQLIRKGSDSGAITRSSTEVSNSAGEGSGDTLAACVLMDRVTTADVAERMPPEGEGTVLDAEQLAVLKAWIELGLPGPEEEAYLTGPSDHWAYQPITRPAVPLLAVPALSVANETITARAATPIDHFVFASQAQRNLQANDQATAADWMRRAAFDLTGLAPSREMLAEITSNDSRTTRARLVDLLLGSPEYGERWGRHWMDVWRYSDWDGYKDELRGSQRHIWHWRDWIVESLNADKPYDEMIVEMLAADEVLPNDPKALRATGFLARNYHISNRDIWLDAAVEHTTKAFLGMTVQCARCHDHKFDPISQEHFYQFRAIFEPHRTRTDQVAGEPDVKRAGVPRVFDAELSAETFLYERGNEKQPRKDKPIQPGVVSWIPAAFEVFPVDLPRDSFLPELSEPMRSNLISAKTRARQRAADELVKLQAAVAKSTEEKAAKDVEADLRLATLKVEFAAADLAALLARYAADDSKYSGHVGSGTRVSDSANRDAIASELAELAREAAVREHAAQRLQAMLNVAESQAALRKANASNVKDEAKRKAAIAAAEKAVVEAEKKLAAFTALAADSVTYTPVGKELPRQSTGRRTALARWIVSPNNPLTARVAVNHIWMRHFGTPLVDNVFDFGMKAPRPELLDMLNWLSAELIESGWSMKHLHRLIVLSEVYALSSDDVDSSRLAKNNAIDPDNRYYWRSNVRRMDAEEVRDNLLVAGGCLDKSFAGPDIDFEVGEDVYRRSIYFRHAYEKQMSMLVLFDAASPGDCYRRRPSVIPQQALALANSGLTRSMARTLVRELEVGDVADDSRFIAALFARTLNRQPTAEELKKCEDFLVQQNALLADPAKLTAVVSASKSTVSAATDPRSRARESLALVLLNHNDFVTVR